MLFKYSKFRYSNNETLCLRVQQFKRRKYFRIICGNCTDESGNSTDEAMELIPS
jgi:hypothetical protein